MLECSLALYWTFPLHALCVRNRPVPQNNFANTRAISSGLSLFQLLNAVPLHSLMLVTSCNAPFKILVISKVYNFKRDSSKCCLKFAKLIKYNANTENNFIINVFNASQSEIF